MVEREWCVDTSQLRGAFKDKWSKTPNHRDWQVAQCRSSTMTTARPRSDREWTTGKGWKNSAPWRIDDVLANGIDLTSYDTNFTEGIPSDHALMIARAARGRDPGTVG